MKAAKILLLTGLTGFLPACLCLAQTWTLTSAPSNSWSCVASSADGTKLVASVNGGGIWLSSRFGSHLDAEQRAGICVVGGGLLR